MGERRGRKGSRDMKEGGRGEGGERKRARERKG